MWWIKPRETTSAFRVCFLSRLREGRAKRGAEVRARRIHQSTETIHWWKRYAFGRKLETSLRSFFTLH